MVEDGKMYDMPEERESAYMTEEEARAALRKALSDAKSFELAFEHQKRQRIAECAELEGRIERLEDQLDMLWWALRKLKESDCGRAR